MIAAKRKNMMWTQVWLLLTGLFGFVFLFIELYEFAQMIGEGAGPQRSAFLSSFFTLVGCHGAHVTSGLLWLGTMMAQIWAKGFQPAHHAAADVLQHLLARPRHHLGRHLHHRLSDRDIAMTEDENKLIERRAGRAAQQHVERDDRLCRRPRPGADLDGHFLLGRIDVGAVGAGRRDGLVVLAIAQMGVHLVFFLHITSGPDNTNNVLALAFGVLIVFLVMIGTIWIMGHMNANMAPTPEMTNLMTQRG